MGLKPRSWGALGPSFTPSQAAEVLSAVPAKPLDAGRTFAALCVDRGRAEVVQKCKYPPRHQSKSTAKLFRKCRPAAPIVCHGVSNRGAFSGSRSPTPPPQAQTSRSSASAVVCQRASHPPTSCDPPRNLRPSCFRRPQFSLLDSPYDLWWTVATCCSSSPAASCASSTPSSSAHFRSSTWPCFSRRPSARTSTCLHVSRPALLQPPFAVFWISRAYKRFDRSPRSGCPPELSNAA